MSVLVTNARNRIAYNVVRSLGRRGVRVYAADFVERSMSFTSRYVAGHFVYPSPFRQQDAFVSCVRREVERLKIDVLIPVFEETFLIAKHKDMLSKSVSMVIPDYSQILEAHNKDRWEQLATRLGIAVPATYATDAARDAQVRSRIQFPVLIKPKQGGGAWGIEHVDTPEMLDLLLRAPDWHGKPWSQFFVQERIAGPTHCVAMLFNKGALRAQVGYRQLRDYPARGGQATLRVSVRHEQAEKYLRRLLETLRWHGPCQADFIIDERTDVPYLIDINPRLWGSLAQAIASGIDFPHLIYRIATEGDVDPVLEYRTNVVTRWIGGDLAALPARLRTAPHKLPVLRDFFLPAQSAALFDDLSLRDPLPFMTWTVDALQRALRFGAASPVTHDSLDGIWE